MKMVGRYFWTIYSKIKKGIIMITRLTRAENRIIKDGGHYRTDDLHRLIYFNYRKVMEADVVYLDEYIIKNRFGVENHPPASYLLTKEFETFWNEKERILKFDSKGFLREQKIKELLEK